MHTIQSVADRTGLTPDVIRVWERRHQAIAPLRTASNQRSYSDDDIERLTLFRRLTDAGMRISNIAALETSELRALCDKQTQTMGRAVSAPPQTDEHQGLAAALQAVHYMDAPALDAVLQKMFVEAGMVRFLTRFVAPLATAVGDRWLSGELRTCQEHFFSAYLRAFLGRFLLEANPSRTGPHIVIATPPGHFHELGALMVAVVAAQSGCQPLYLGASVPLEELVFAVHTKRARFVTLSMTYPVDDDKLPGFLTQLRQQLPGDVALITGGSSSQRYLAHLQGDNTHHPDSLEAFAELLKRLRS
jgi:DNA-binding transcriptional MerR regulator/methylmalonyl-CoA mutase cobalamin-binding subunit